MIHVLGIHQVPFVLESFDDEFPDGPPPCHRAYTIPPVAYGLFGCAWVIIDGQCKPAMQSCGDSVAIHDQENGNATVSTMGGSTVEERTRMSGRWADVEDSDLSEDWSSLSTTDSFRAQEASQSVGIAACAFPQKPSGMQSVPTIQACRVATVQQRVPAFHGDQPTCAGGQDAGARAHQKVVGLSCSTPSQALRTSASPFYSRSLPTQVPKARMKRETRRRTFAASLVSNSCEFTTLMMRNLPDDLSCDDLADFLNEQGFRGKYDFAYIPLVFKTWISFGYAFVNFVTSSDARAAWDRFQGFRWPGSSEKICAVTWCTHQGCRTLVERFRNSAVMHEAVRKSAKPVLYKNGVRIAFPPPTTEIKMPKHGRRDRREA